MAIRYYDDVIAAKLKRWNPIADLRVLKPNGVLIFKWNEVEVPISKILHLFGKQPLFGHASGKRMNTHWVCFMKEA